MVRGWGEGLGNNVDRYMVGRRQKNLKITLAKTPLNSPQKNKFGPGNK